MKHTNSIVAVALTAAIAATSIGTASAMAPGSTHWVSAEAVQLDTEFQVYDANFKFKKFKYGGFKKKKFVGGFGKKKFKKFKF